MSTKLEKTLEPAKKSVELEFVDIVRCFGCNTPRISHFSSTYTKLLEAGMPVELANRFMKLKYNMRLCCLSSMKSQIIYDKPTMAYGKRIIPEGVKVEPNFFVGSLGEHEEKYIPAKEGTVRTKDISTRDVRSELRKIFGHRAQGNEKKEEKILPKKEDAVEKLTKQISKVSLLSKKRDKEDEDVEVKEVKPRKFSLVKKK